jgi:hypothetical protein
VSCAWRRMRACFVSDKEEQQRDVCSKVGGTERVLAHSHFLANGIIRRAGMRHSDILRVVCR